jgi:hypothetical protein
MNKIHTIDLGGFTIDILHHNGSIAYSMDYNGQAYGSKLKLPSKSVLDIVSTTALLIVNALDTRKALLNDDK